jgi:hypothetical protein
VDSLILGLKHPPQNGGTEVAQCGFLSARENRGHETTVLRE